MNTKNHPFIWLTFFLFSCQPSTEIYSSILKNIREGSHYYIYDNLTHVDTENAVYHGELTANGLFCLSNYKEEHFPGKAEDEYTLVIEGIDNTKYYFSIRAIDKKIKTISPWKEKLKYGFKGSSLALKINCSVDEFGD